MNDFNQNATVKGIVLKSETYGEKAKLITVLTDKLGTIRLLASGGNNAIASYFKCVQLFSYSTLTFKSSPKGNILTEAELIENFYDLRKDLRVFSLACYFADVCSTISVPDDEMPLRVFLNSLFALCKKLADNDKVKAVFELKTAYAAGFFPNIDECAFCGRRCKGNVHRFSISEGAVICDDCAEKAVKADIETIQINDTILDTINFIENIDPKKMFSFSLSEQDMGLLETVSEQHLLYYLEKEMPTLDFYKQMKVLQ